MSRSGSLRRRIAVWTAAMSYATRCQVTISRSRSMTAAARARVAVARLADTARIDQAASGVQRQRRAVGRTHRLDEAVLVPEDRREMRVAVEPVGRLQQLEVAPGDWCRGDVLPGRVARAAMDEAEARLGPPFGQCGEPRARGRADGGSGPLHRPAGVVVERVDLEATDGRGVVIAADADRPELAQPTDDPIGVRAVADDVAEMPDRIHRADGVKHGIERDEVGVDVGQESDPHRESFPQFGVRALDRSGGADRSLGPAAQSGDRRRTAGSRG